MTPEQLNNLTTEELIQHAQQKADEHPLIKVLADELENILNELESMDRYDD